MKAKYFILMASYFFCCGCGVKGDPRPPQTPTEIGRGQPTYRRATEEFAVPDAPPAPTDDSQKKKSDGQN